MTYFIILHPLNRRISGTAKAGDFNFCMRVDHVHHISLSISNCFPIGRFQGHITYLNILDSENFTAANRSCIGLVNIFTNGQLFDFTYEAPLGSSPPNFSPNSPKFLGVGANFASALYGDHQGPSVIKFCQLYLGPLPGKKVPKFRRKSCIYLRGRG